ncbi:MAG: hypothetical protein JO130_13040 [Solirubrobacterales bacterium]|nr:hypothetical protein [Solirubrobacterales bacterium]
MSGGLRLDLLPVTQPSQIGDPAATAPVVGPDVPPGRQRAPSPRLAPAGASPSTPGPAPAVGPDPWRDWSSFDRTVSYRLPPELVSELEERIYQLRLPAGLTVAAALTSLLDLDDAQLQARVARAETCKPRRRRRGDR